MVEHDMRQRKELIQELQELVNERCHSNLTYQQVDYFVGKHMKNASIEQWIDETDYNRNPVTADMILEKWNSYTFLA